MELLNFVNGKKLIENQFHDDAITDFDMNLEKNIVLTSSKDGSSVLFSLETFEIINKIQLDNPIRNLNACQLCFIGSSTATADNSLVSESESFSNIDINKFCEFDNTNFTLSMNDTPTRDESFLTVLAGGQDCKLVTTTNQKQGGFEVLGFDTFNTDKSSDTYSLFSYNYHFGPVNSLSYSKNKKILASGAEDSTVRLYYLNSKIFNPEIK
jgi:WD40 repeat protein